jgi:hypothetical protein
VIVHNFLRLTGSLWIPTLDMPVHYLRLGIFSIWLALGYRVMSLIFIRAFGFLWSPTCSIAHRKFFWLLCCPLCRTKTTLNRSIMPINRQWFRMFYLLNVFLIEVNSFSLLTCKRRRVFRWSFVRHWIASTNHILSPTFRWLNTLDITSLVTRLIQIIVKTMLLDHSIWIFIFKDGL